MKVTGLHRQQGLSLIELMISVTLGLVLMGAATQVMLSNNQTYRLNDDVSRIQENGRIALDILVQDLRMSGYRKPLNGDGRIPDFFLKDCTAGDVDLPCAADGKQPEDSDRLSIQFDPPPDDGTETNCLGEPVPDEDIIVNVYTVQYNDVDQINSLYCRGYNASTQTWTSPEAVALVNGIDNLQVLYGLAGGDPDNPASTTRYVPYTQLIDTDWPNVRSVRIGLLVSNGMAQGSSEVKPRRYRVLDGGIINTTDGQARRIYTTTVQFNNSSL